MGRWRSSDDYRIELEAEEIAVIPGHLNGWVSLFYVREACLIQVSDRNKLGVSQLHKITDEIGSPIAAADCTDP
jgi:hypothetical protein